jgi:hypothetical protein
MALNLDNLLQEFTSNVNRLCPQLNTELSMFVCQLNKAIKENYFCPDCNKRPIALTCKGQTKYGQCKRRIRNHEQFCHFHFENGTVKAQYTNLTKDSNMTVRCKAITKSFYRCQRQTRSPEQYCYQHYLKYSTQSKIFPGPNEPLVLGEPKTARQEGNGEASNIDEPISASDSPGPNEPLVLVLVLVLGELGEETASTSLCNIQNTISAANDGPEETASTSLCNIQNTNSAANSLANDEETASTSLCNIQNMISAANDRPEETASTSLCNIQNTISNSLANQSNSSSPGPNKPLVLGEPKISCTSDSPGPNEPLVLVLGEPKISASETDSLASNKYISKPTQIAGHVIKFCAFACYCVFQLFHHFIYTIVIP